MVLSRLTANVPRLIIISASVLMFAACTNELLVELGKIRESTVSPKVTLSIKDGTALANGSTHEFGEVGVADTAESIFVITNGGVTDLSIPEGSVSFTGTDSTLFTFGTHLPATLGPGNSAEFSIKFSPGTIGAKDASMSFTTNDVDNPGFSLSLSGIGIDQVPAPVFENGTFQCYPVGPFNIKIRCSNTAAKIYYTTNGSDPSVDRLDVGTTLYTSTGIDMSPLTATVYIKAIAKVDGLKDSAIVMATISKDDVQQPTISLSDATTFGPESVIPAIRIDSATGNAGIFYTVDGSDPASSTSTRVSLANGASFTYSGEHADGKFTLKTVAFITGAPPSATATATYYFKLSPPVFSPVPKANPATELFTSPITITMTTPTMAGTTISYDVNGATPISNTTYTIMATDSAEATVTANIKAKASLTNWKDSDETAVQTYKVNPLGIWGETGTPKSYWDNANWE